MSQNFESLPVPQNPPLHHSQSVNSMIKHQFDVSQAFNHVPSHNLVYNAQYQHHHQQHHQPMYQGQYMNQHQNHHIMGNVLMPQVYANGPSQGMNYPLNQNMGYANGAQGFNQYWL